MRRGSGIALAALADGNIPTQERLHYGAWKVVAEERMHDEPTTGPKAVEGCQLIAESNCFKSASSGEKRGKRQEVTQRGGMSG